jgi:hypothetical protein
LPYNLGNAKRAPNGSQFVGIFSPTHDDVKLLRRGQRRTAAGVDPAAFKNFGSPQWTIFATFC